MLRVGVSPDAPPIAFMREGRIVGIEPDLAQALVDHFRRPLALDADGVRIADPRAARRPHRRHHVRHDRDAGAARCGWRSPIRTCARASWPASGAATLAKYRTRDAILATAGNVGVRAGSTAESWAQANLPYANIASYPSITDAARELSQGRLDLIISDTPQVAWAVSEYSGMLQVVRVLLTQEDIAWAFRPQDTRLRDAANGALAAMRQDGRLRGILQRWIPYLDELERAR